MSSVAAPAFDPFTALTVGFGVSEAPLGELVIVSVRESTQVPFQALQDWWHANGFEGVPVPRQGNAKDAFRKATPKGAKDKRFYFMPYDGQARPEGVVDAVVLVESTDEGDRVGKRHRNWGNLLLTDQNTVTFESDYMLTTAAEGFLNQIRADYERNRNFASPRQVRGMVIRALEMASKLTYHDGVHLVPAVQSEKLDKICAFVEWLTGYSEDPQKLFRIPYADTPETRKDVRDVLQASVNDECDRVISEAREFVNSVKDPRKRIGGRNKGQSLLIRLTELGGMIADYERVLSEQQDFLKVALGQKQGLVREILGLDAAGNLPAIGLP
jgi:hypothetical protein